MCIQVPCVYLLSAASTVIRNTIISPIRSRSSMLHPPAPMTYRYFWLKSVSWIKLMYNAALAYLYFVARDINNFFHIERSAHFFRNKLCMSGPFCVWVRSVVYSCATYILLPETTYTFFLWNKLYPCYLNQTVPMLSTPTSAIWNIFHNCYLNKFCPVIWNILYPPPPLWRTTSTAVIWNRPYPVTKNIPFPYYLK